MTLLGRKKIVIIGAGISGLTLGLRLKENPDFDVVVLERKRHAGGWVRTLHTDAGYFEVGPRGIRLRGQSGSCLYQMIQDLNLEKEVIFSSQAAQRRFIYLDESLQEVSQKPWLWPFSKATRSLPLALLKEPFQAARSTEDMTLEAFFKERLGWKTYQLLIEPAILGIFGCQGRYLSAKSCLPTLWKWREKWGSLSLGFITNVLKSKTNCSYPELPLLYRKSALVSFKKGMSQLTHAMANRLRSSLMLGHQLLALRWSRTRHQFLLKTSQTSLEADCVILACSPWNLSGCMLDLPETWFQFQKGVQSNSLIVVSLAYSEPVSSSLGFGYLVPSFYKSAVMGTVIDSNIFASHSSGYPTRISVMLDASHKSLKGCLENSLQIARQALSKHLHWDYEPQWSTVTLVNNALPIYGLGHNSRLQALQNSLKQQTIPLYMTGMGYQSFALSDCVLQANELAESLLAT